jgi:transcriptional regulator with XRE-family HTH domain
MARLGTNPTDEPTLADHLRAAARASGLSVRQLAMRSETDQSTLNKFLNGERPNLRLDIADRLFRVLGLRVVPTTRRPKSPP